MDNELWWNDALKSSAEGVVLLRYAKRFAIYRPKVVETDVVSPSPRFRNIAFEQDDNGYNELNVSFAAMSFVERTKGNVQNKSPWLFQLDRAHIG